MLNCNALQFAELSSAWPNCTELNEAEPEWSWLKNQLDPNWTGLLCPAQCRELG